MECPALLSETFAQRNVAFFLIFLIVIIGIPLISVLISERKSFKDSEKRYYKLYYQELANVSYWRMQALLFEDLLKKSKIPQKISSSFSKDEIEFLLKKAHPDLNGNSKVSNEATRKILAMRK